MRRILLTIALLFSVLPAFSSPLGFGELLDSPLYAVSYSGSVEDSFANPASLSLVENGTSSLAVSAMVSDSWDTSKLGKEKMSFLQNGRSELQASFMTKHFAFTGSFATTFEDRRMNASGNPVFDIYTGLNLQIDASYAFPYVSFGVRMKGGNRMVRAEKEVAGFSAVIANAWFSPFEREANSESFSAGLGMIVRYRFFSAGIYIDEILALNEKKSISVDLGMILRSSTVSLSLQGDRFSKSGDLAFFRPRLSVSITGLNGNGKLEAEADLALQFLPDSSLVFAVSYYERPYSLGFKPENGVFSFLAKGVMSKCTLTLGASFSASDWKTVSPFIVFSYIS